jgi:3-methyladenine DNA glycosylase AlkD
MSKVLRALGNPDIAEHSQRFFKTGKGEYGEGDKFLGIRVPVLRKHAKQFKAASLKETTKLLKSPYHEERLCALFMLVDRFAKGDPTEKQKIYDLYLKHTPYINSWDLVDSSAHKIVGAYLEAKDKQPIYDMARSHILWERRIAVIATFYLINTGEFDDALAIATTLLNDPEDLIHKAVGWMLREIGNRDVSVEKVFLKKHYKHMPRTMLRYAIEKFPEAQRKKYLQGKI